MSNQNFAELPKYFESLHVVSAVKIYNIL